MKDELPRVINLDMRLLPLTDDAWTTRGLRKSGREYDEVECQMAIADFLADHHDRDEIAE